MTGGEDETVAVEPLGRGWVVAHRVAIEHRSDIGGAERESEVAGAASVHGVDGETTGFVGGGREGF